jgi:hypothetical protein
LVTHLYLAFLLNLDFSGEEIKNKKSTDLGFLGLSGQEVKINK